MPTYRELHTQLALLKSVLKAVRAGMIVLDAEQRVVLWNNWVQQHSSFATQDGLGKTFAELFPELVDSRVHVAIGEALYNNMSSIVSQTLHKSPFPLFANASDRASGVRMRQAVHVMPIEVETLPRHCLVQIADVSMAVKRENKLREQALELESLTLADGLTGIANRRRFDMHLEDEFRRAKRNGSPISIIMIDVDCFKDYNDNYGHQQGDHCLVQIAGALSRILRRPCDLVARYGGEEFIVALPDTNAEGALRVAEAMRAAVNALALDHAFSTVTDHVTISLGIATRVPDYTAEPATLIDMADRALYGAKRAGRNCVMSRVDTAPAVV
jgi:diguanylate cyclase (GGDEF)-like protein